jgi:hypothetical protein
MGSMLPNLSLSPFLAALRSAFSCGTRVGGTPGIIIYALLTGLQALQQGATLRL